MLEQLFYEFLDKICQETARPKYQLSDLSLSQMRWLCQNCELLILKERDLEQDRISVPLHTCTGELFQNLKVLPFPMTLQHLPLYEQEQPVLPKPKVILIDAPRYQPFQESILFHEICHLFSIGTLEQVPHKSPPTFLYHSGLNSWVLEATCKSRYLNICSENLHYRENEQINDLAALILFKNIMPKNKEYFLQDETRRFVSRAYEEMAKRNISEEQVIRNYFEHSFEAAFTSRAGAH